MSVPSRPILLNSCARAATAAEARFRINTPIAPARATRVIALDDAAAVVVRGAAGERWSAGARFFLGTSATSEAGAVDVILKSVDGVESWLSDELTGADVVVMVATSNDGAQAASAIGNACTLRGIMTAGLVLPGSGGSHGDTAPDRADGPTADEAVSALRPHARVLLVTRDADDVAETLAALRA